MFSDRVPQSAKIFLVTSKEKNSLTVSIEGDLFRGQMVEVVLVTGMEVISKNIIPGDTLEVFSRRAGE